MITESAVFPDLPRGRIQPSQSHPSRLPVG